MITYNTRPLTDAERTEIEALQRDNTSQRAGLHVSLRIAALWVVGTLAALCFLSLLNGFLEARGMPDLLRRFVLLVLGIWAGLFCFDTTRRERHRAEREREQMAAWHDSVLAGGSMDVLQVEAMGVVVVNDYDGEYDTQDGYFLDLGDSTVLCLAGEYLDEPIQSGAFPCTRFDLFRFPGQTEIHGIECQGEPLPVIETLDWQAVESDYKAADGDVFPASLSTLASDLKRFVVPKSEKD